MVHQVEWLPGDLPIGRISPKDLSLRGKNENMLNFIIITYFKLRVGFHPVAVALQNDTQIKHITNRIQITYTSNTQNKHIKYKYRTKY
jgi:hypothetical protein